MTENDLLLRVADLARTIGWRVKHDRHALSARGYRTPVQFDGAGWPDLFMTHPSGDSLARELKLWARRKHLAAAQAEWLQALQRCGIDAGFTEPERDQPFGVWTEEDWDDIIVPRLLRNSTARVTQTAGHIIT